jgi:ABC-type lipoprotein export system ATPase subunit
MPADDIAIRATNLSKRYRSGDDELVVFAGLNLEVRRGERLAIIGESGAGKSTLLHIMGGLDRPSDGSVFVGSQDITSLGDTELADMRNRAIGFVWQIHYLLPEFTALENVMMPLLIRGVSRLEAAAAALTRLDEVGLKARATHRAGELSGGEQQRVVLARALVGNRGTDFRNARRVASIARTHLYLRHSQPVVRQTLRPGFEAGGGRVCARHAGGRKNVCLNGTRRRRAG